MNHFEGTGMEGTTFGRYQLVEVLGRGGMGEVWRSFDTVTERTVAVKVLPAHLAGDEGFQKRFLREAKAAASLNEPHIVPIYDFGEIDGRLFVAMRLVEGHDLQAMLAYGPLEPGRAVGIVEQVASALHAAHQIGLVHRDVKPSNILVAEDDFAYLIDFGIARAAGETGLTSTGMTLGTWPYMAPERFRTGTADARADVYALTCVLHQALTGQQPFPGESLEQIAAGHMFDPPPRPSAIRGSVPAAMDDVIATGMAKDPDERYATTRALAQAARAALPAPFSHATIDAAGAATLAAPAPTLNDAPTHYAPTEAARDHSATLRAELPKRSRRRPASLTAAVIIAGLIFVLYALVAMFGLHEGSVARAYPDMWQYSTILLIIGVESLMLAAFLVWAAVVAFRGIERRGLLFAPAVAALLMTVAFIIGLAIGDASHNASFLMFFQVIFLLPVPFLVSRQSSKEFFQAQP